MEKLLTTKDLAEAIGASESSMRRWTNSGAIRTSRTVGGHRRIPLSEAFRFIRESHSTVIRPDLLGLNVAAGKDKGARAASLYEALAAGDVSRAQGEILSSYLEGESAAGIFDEVIQPSMQRLGELWQHDARGIMVEHRATDICLGAINALRRSLPQAPVGAPIAVGGAGSGDPYLIPSLMAATVLAECGYRDQNFGPDTPLEVLSAAAEEQKASLVWLSVSRLGARETLQEGVKKLAARLEELKIPLAVGGRHAEEVVSKPLPNVQILKTMSELGAFARGVAPGAEARQAAPDQ